MTRIEFLVAAVVFLALLAFIVWVISLFKAKIPEKPKVFDGPGAQIDDLTEHELILARADLMIKSRALQNTEELVRVRADLARVEARLSELRNDAKSTSTKNPA